MSPLRKIPWYVRTALIVTVISLLPVSIFFFFHYSEMRPQWEAEALEAYEQGVTSVSKDLANTIDELKLKSDFLLDSTVIQNAVLHVDTYSLVESLSFIHELTDVMDAITLENPYISLRFYPERCTYSLGTFCKSFDLFYSDYGETPILQETLLTIPNRSSLLVLREDPDTGESILALCSRLQLFGGAGAVLELSVPIEQTVSIPEILPAEAELQLLLTNETYETTPVILQTSNLQKDTDCLVLRRTVGKHTDLEITCSLPRQNIQSAVNRGSTVTFGLLIVLMVVVFFVSLITARLFYVRMLLLINNIGDKVDGVLHGSPVESKSTSDLKLLEEKIYQLVDQTKLYYESNLQYAEMQQHMELELLQMRFNPHFLYNTLNTLRFRARNPAIQRVVDSLVQYYRIVLNKGDLIICLKDEMTLIEEYLKIEQFSYSITNVTWEIYLDPEVANCAVIKHILQPIVENDFSSEIVFTCGSGEVLLQASIQELPDIVLSDISMPGMSGLELAAQLRTISPHTKVVLISCFSDFEFAQKAIELGIVGYIVKPIQKENLVHTMKRVVETIAEEHFAKAALKHRDKVLSIAQQSIWMNLLMAGGKDDNIEEQLSLLHLQVPKQPRIRVTRIRLLDQQSQEEMDYQIQRVALLLEQALTSRKDTWMVRPDKVSLILIHITEQGQEDSINDLMTKLCIEAETQAKQRIKIGVSNTADQYSALPALYSQAFHASRRNCGQYLAVTPYEEVVTWTNTENNGEPKEERSGITFYSGSEKQNSKVESRYKETAEQIKRHVEAHYMESITTADVAKAVFLSPSYANTVFRKSCGMTIFDYILVCRINKAKELLQNTSFPVSKIAELIGYNSKANFYLAFKRLTDMSPTEYRNRAWEGDVNTFEPYSEL